MQDREINTKELPLNASYLQVRDFYAKKEYYTRFFKRLQDRCSRDFGKDKTIEAFKIIKNPRTTIRGLEEFFSKDFYFSIGLQALKVASTPNEFIEKCKIFVEDVLRRSYTNVDLTYVLTYATLLVPEGICYTFGFNLAKVFCTRFSNPFTIDFLGKDIVSTYKAKNRETYYSILSGFIEGLVECRNENLCIPTIYRANGVLDKPRRRIMEYLYTISEDRLSRTEVNKIFEEVEDFSIYSAELEGSFHAFSKAMERPYPYAKWLMKKVENILKSSTLTNYGYESLRRDSIAIRCKNANAENMRILKAKDKYISKECFGKAKQLESYVNIYYDCKGCTMEELDPVIDNLLLVSIIKERISSSEDHEHRVTLTNCESYTTEFIQFILDKIRRVRSKFNKNINIRVEFAQEVAESRMGISEPEYLRVISDLHIDVNAEEMYDFNFGNDFVVSCGDIAGDYATVRDFAQTHLSEGILIVGNHLGYNTRYGMYGAPSSIPLEHGWAYSASKEGQVKKLRQSFQKEAPVTLLELENIKRHGIIFLGSTMYSDFRIFGEEKQAACMMEASMKMNDYRRCIELVYENNKIVVKPYTVDSHLSRFRRFVASVTKQLQVLSSVEPDTPIVLATHFAPAPYAIAPEYKNDPLTAAFVSDMRWMVEKFPNIRAWFFGHTHSPFDFIYKQCRFVCNPFGYFNENHVNIEEYGTRIKLDDIRSNKPWTEILQKEVFYGNVKVYD